MKKIRKETKREKEKEKGKSTFITLLFLMTCTPSSCNRRASVASLCAETSRIREIEKKAREAERKAEESERSGKKVILTLREMDTMVNRMKVGE